MVENPTRAQRRRIARYESLTGALRTGTVGSLAFEARIGGWLAYADGLHFEWDPEVVLAILAERAAAGEDLFIYNKDEES